MDSSSPFLAASGLGHLLKNFHSRGMAALPGGERILTLAISRKCR